MYIHNINKKYIHTHTIHVYIYIILPSVVAAQKVQTSSDAP